MAENQDKINQLQERLDSVFQRQELFSEEIAELRKEIHNLKSEDAKATASPVEEKEVTKILQQRSPQQIHVEENLNLPSEPNTAKLLAPPAYSRPKIEQQKRASNLEKFIGENLINKIGIVITVIGVAIGAKYSIDHQLISPWTRILLGYLMGFGLLATGLKLKQKYENYSAVLVSGAMSIMYFITYFAFSFYDLIPQIPSFLLMVIFTVATVYAALKYNKQVIAHIGLVGAYAVPFLLSKDSGNATILFSYMSIINIGILIISFRKDWKPLYYVSFLLSWLIYLTWLNLNYQSSEHFALGLIFAAVFFGIFYLTFLAYNLRGKANFYTEDRLLLLANSGVFFGIGYYILNNHEVGTNFSGAFTAGNALVHLIVSAVIYRQKLADRNLFYFVAGLFIVFITIAIPVQFDGKWVTVLWVGEAALLFWIGRTKAEPVYEKLSYPLMMIATFSLLHDWITGYHQFGADGKLLQITPIFNLNFLNSLLFIASFGFINILNSNKNYASALTGRVVLRQLLNFLLPAVFLSVIYFAFRLEIASFFQQLYENSATGIDPVVKNTELQSFKSLWMTIYSLVFLTILSFANILKLKLKEFGFINLSLIVIAILVFLINDLYILGNLRQTYMQETLAQLYPRGIIYITFRYVSFVFIALMLYTTYIYIRQPFLKYNFRMYFDLLLHVTILWIASAELINWMDLSGSDTSYKLGLSILWGVYSLILISLGIWKKKKHLRIGAIALFAVTLIKLFAYDISHLETIPKTIIFISLGILLLIISFLYNKYKHIISEEMEN
ncbi:MAG: DUF2339 domain-containing protein [Prolixibacteraceae bacterium]|nr:DUF2339 domain-containing protein [Prolixibacteraceae bacterium]